AGLRESAGGRGRIPAPRGCAVARAPAIIRGSPEGIRRHARFLARACGLPGRGLPTHRDSYAQRQSPRKRAFRVCPAPLQAHLRKGRRPGRNPQARVLREADPGAQAQGRCCGQAPSASRLARRDQAPAPLLRPAVPIRKPATPRVAGFLCLGNGESEQGIESSLPPSAPKLPIPQPSGFPLPTSGPPPMTLKQRLTDDMKAAMKGGEKERLATIRLANAAIKQREVDERITLDDTAVIAVLDKMIKQRRDS